ncbi:hypothetical protein [Niallia sp. Krafla_26]|uniref:hypothetical protein n=1 Tax=Niallia sp. Krafla_26 TaxID=3064703 RepID=UPI003D16B931
MRKKRASTHRKPKNKTNKSLIQAASLASIAAFGMAQVLPSSHAAFTNTETVIDGDISLSFVFPETIQELIKGIEEENQSIFKSKNLAVELLNSMMGAESSEIARGYAVEIDKLLENAIGVQKAISEQVNGLHTHYYEKALKEAKNNQSTQQVLEMIEKEGLKPAEKITAELENSIKEIKGIQEQANKKVSNLEDNEKLLITELTKKALESMNNSNNQAFQRVDKYKGDLNIIELQTLARELSSSQNDLQASIATAQQSIKDLENFINHPGKYTVVVIEEAKQNLEKIKSNLKTLEDNKAKIQITQVAVQAGIWQDSNNVVSQMLAQYKEGMGINELKAFSTELSKTEDHLQTVLNEAEAYTKGYNVFINQNKNSFTEAKLKEAKQSEEHLQSVIKTAKENIINIKITHAKVQSDIWKSLNLQASELITKNREKMDVKELETLITELNKTQSQIQSVLKDAEKYEKEYEKYLNNNKKSFSEQILNEANKNHQKMQTEINSLKINVEKIQITNADIHVSIWKYSNQQASELLATYREDMELKELETFITKLFEYREDMFAQLKEAEKYTTDYLQNIDGKGTNFSKELMEVAKINYEKLQLEIANFKKNIDQMNKIYADIKVKIDQKKQKQEAKKVQEEKQKQSNQPKQENLNQKDKSESSNEVQDTIAPEETKVETETIKETTQTEPSSIESESANGDE